MEKLVDGNVKSATQALREIAPQVNAPSVEVTRMKKRPEIKHAIRLLQHRRELRLGIEIGRKRSLLMDIIENCKAEAPQVAISAVKELNLMDGHHAPKQVALAGQVNLVSVEYNLDTGRTIEGEKPVFIPPPQNPILHAALEHLEDTDSDNNCDNVTVIDALDWLK